LPPELEPMPLEAEAAPQIEPVFEEMPQREPEPDQEPEPELVLTEFEAAAVSAEPEAPAPAMDEPEPEKAPFWPPSSEDRSSWSDYAEPEEEPAQTQGRNGSHRAYEAEETSSEALPLGSSKSLEDSVKDMLRPMLRKWLDENMSRVLTAALKDELRDGPHRQQD
jgi:uncharacterized protein